jgi:hypothetical protein
MSSTGRRGPVLRWLLDSDPSVRWQVMRDLADAPPEEVWAERSKVATEGLGARLLGLQASDGRWGGAAWNRGWNSTMHVLALLREMGLDPASGEARRAVGLVRDRVTWRGSGPPEVADHPFFAGEVEPCINGQVGAVGAYFGQDVGGLVGRLLDEQLPDGGWNCEAADGSTRSSFNTTICVLEALLEHERAVGGGPALTGARLRGQEYLLDRRFFRRRSTGQAIERDRKGATAWTRFASPRGGTTTCCGGWSTSAVPVWRPTSASPRRSTWWCPSGATTGGGCWRPSTRARWRSRRTRPRGGRAGGTPSGPCASWTGVGPETDAGVTGRIPPSEPTAATV